MREKCTASQHVLVWAAHDGVETQTSGIAVLTSYFSHDAAEIRTRIEDSFQSRSATYIAYPAKGRAQPHNHNTPVYDKETGLVPLVDSTSDYNPFGSSVVWGSWCSQLAQWVRSIECPDIHIVIIANDTPFFGMVRALRALGALRIDCVTVVHSIARIWDPTLGIAEERRRDEWERQGLEVAISHRMPVIAVSEYVKLHLTNHFALPSSAIAVQPPRHSAATLTALLSRRRWANDWLDAEGVPSDTQVVIWSGRNIAAKAPDIARSAFMELVKDSHSAHMLMFLRDDLSRLRNPRDLTGRSGQLRTYYDFPFTLPRQLIATARIQCVLISSRSEPHGLIPEESIILSTLTDTSIIPVMSRVGGLGDQEEVLRDGVEFYDDPESFSAAATAISKALSKANTGAPNSGQLQAYHQIRATGTFTDWITGMLNRITT